MRKHYARPDREVKQKAAGDHAAEAVEPTRDHALRIQNPNRLGTNLGVDQSVRVGQFYVTSHIFPWYFRPYQPGTTLDNWTHGLIVRPRAYVYQSRTSQYLG